MTIWKIWSCQVNQVSQFQTVYWRKWRTRWNWGGRERTEILFLSSRPSLLRWGKWVDTIQLRVWIRPSMERRAGEEKEGKKGREDTLQFTSKWFNSSSSRCIHSQSNCCFSPISITCQSQWCEYNLNWCLSLIFFQRHKYIYFQYIGGSNLNISNISTAESFGNISTLQRQSSKRSFASSGFGSSKSKEGKVRLCRYYICEINFPLYLNSMLLCSFVTKHD